MLGKIPPALRRTLTRTLSTLSVCALTALSLAALPSPPAAALDNALGLTPQMGWNSWNAYHCDIDENKIKSAADHLVSTGLRDAGYTYVNIDDCWQRATRDGDGNLVADPDRFPAGINALADYVHAKGLKLGIYATPGSRTCANIFDNYPGQLGSLGHEEQDAQTFAAWGVDYLKYDWCRAQQDGVDPQAGFTTMRDALQTTGRPIFYSIHREPQLPVDAWRPAVANSWRTSPDIRDNWTTMLRNLKNNLPLNQYAGPGHWNDPDMLEVGNGGMTATEYRTHFSLWSVMASPLLIGTDLAAIDDDALAILENREVVGVDQDPLGRQGSVLSSQDGRWVIVKEMADGSRTVALFNETAQTQRIATDAQAVGLPRTDGYTLRDLWQHQSYNTAGTISAEVPAHGTVLLRVAADHTWATLPPALKLTAHGDTYAELGNPATLTTTADNLGRTPAARVTVSLDAPDGWRIEATTPPADRLLPGGKALRTAWKVTAPQGTTPGDYELTATAAYRSLTGKAVTLTTRSPVAVVVAPPSGRSAIGDRPLLQATNGWGPVEKDMSNGERAAKDGHPLTIGATLYPRGLGVHAASSVGTYTGGRCSAFTAQVGLDDEAGSSGTVAFEVWADGTQVAATGVLTNQTPAQTISVDVTGAQVVRLVVGDGGDGNAGDHADWAQPEVTCD
ncbi:alpha-galactosidase [Streptomyces maremycinicus]|nr:alpha-galactosidase [Streptomyces sp. B9173]